MVPLGLTSSVEPIDENFYDIIGATFDFASSRRELYWVGAALPKYSSASILGAWLEEQQLAV